MTALITVRVHGCVRDMGEMRLRAGSSVAAAIRRAGGVGRDSFRGTGIITVRNRRKKDGFPYRRRVIDATKTNPAEVELRDRDFIVVQYDVASRKEANQSAETTRGK